MEWNMHNKGLLVLGVLASFGVAYCTSRPAVSATSDLLTPIQYSKKKDKADDGGSKKGDKKGGDDKGDRDRGGDRDRDRGGDRWGGGPYGHQRHCHWERFRHRWEWVCPHHRGGEGRRY